MQDRTKIFWLMAGLGVWVSGCHDAEVHYEDAVVDEPIVSMNVDVGSGDITLRGDDVSEVTLEARIEGASNHVAHEVEDGHLTVFDDCHEDQCSVDVNLLVPAGLWIAIRTGSGDVQVEGTQSTLLLRTGSGDITGSSVLGVDLDAETGSGDVGLEVPGEIAQLLVKTGSGDVDLGVPSGAYRLSVSTGSGDREVHGVEGTSDAAGLIQVHTGSGDVVIRGH